MLSNILLKTVLTLVPCLCQVLRQVPPEHPPPVHGPVQQPARGGGEGPAAAAAAAAAVDGGGGFVQRRGTLGAVRAADADGSGEKQK